MDATTWAIIGIIFLIAEVVTPFPIAICFFGLGALLVSALTGFGMLADPTWQWLAFSLASILSLLGLRPYLIRLTGGVEGDGKGDRASLDGESAIALSPLPPGGIGKVEARGTIWSARNVGQVDIGEQERCVVERIDGLTLEVVKK